MLRGFVCVVGAVEEAEVVGCLVGLVSYYCRWQGWLLIFVGKGGEDVRSQSWKGPWTGHPG